jgi:ABC-type polysaccharide/polyol phosphate export permease
MKNLKSILYLSNLEYKALHNKKYLGLIWKFLNPLIFVMIYTLVFSSLNSGGKRGFIISTGVLLFSGISASINSSKTWIQPKLLNIITNPKSLIIYFSTKVYYNFSPIIYLTPILIYIQRLFFNIDFKFSYYESFEIFIKLNFLILFTIFYCILICIPISILCKQYKDFNDIISHSLRVFLYLSPILWTAKTEFTLINTALQVINPVYFIFEILNFIIYRSYQLSYISFLMPVVLSIFVFFFYFKDYKIHKIINKYLYK